jgi:hypothetical protein
MQEGDEQGSCCRDGAQQGLLRFAARGSRPDTAYPAAIAFVAFIGSFNTLHNADRFSARGLVRPISQK